MTEKKETKEAKVPVQETPWCLFHRFFEMAFPWHFQQLTTIMVDFLKMNSAVLKEAAKELPGRDGWETC